MSKRCLVLSYGPVPTPEHKKVEGGGLRCWGLAKGLKANDPDLKVTVAYHQSYKQDNFTDKYEDIGIDTWNIDDVNELLTGYDAVVVSYCMGDLSVAVADAVRPDQQLILDCYVPIYVEVSARDSDDLDREYNAFHADVGKWAHVLERGDLFLCSSEPQRDYYKGVLSALGRINPVTYNEELIRIVPYGIYRENPKATEKPISKLIGKSKEDVKKILWFGGIYPWFDLKNLVDAVKRLNEKIPAKLVIVGAKNPFNSHPDFVRPYEELIEYINSDPTIKNLVVLQDWVDFEKRADWYLDSDIVVVINKIGEENKLAWRTRLVDFMWADLPIITNGGDPLGTILLDNDAAVELSGLRAEDISKDLYETLHDGKKLSELRSNISSLKKQFYWDVSTKQLSSDIQEHKQAQDLVTYGKQSIKLPKPAIGKVAKVKKIAKKSRMLPTYARKYGTKNTYYAVRTKVRNQLRRRANIGVRTKPGVVMIAHQLDHSGAPYVFMDLTKSILEAQPNIPLEFHTFNPTHKDNIVGLNKMGIKPNIHIVKEVEIPLTKGDTVVLNTVAHATSLKANIYSSLESGIANKLVWFIHEDEPEHIFDPKEKNRIQKLLEKDKIIIFIAAKKALGNYQEYFENTKNIRKQSYKYVIPKKFHKIRKANDFDELSFILPGTVGDGRKGQLPIFYAFKAFIDKYYEKNKEAYRNFELVYVGLSDDFLSRQIRKHAPKLLGNKFKNHGKVSHEKSMELMMNSNMTICYSLGEC